MDLEFIPRNIIAVPMSSFIQRECAKFLLLNIDEKCLAALFVPAMGIRAYYL